MSFLYVDEGIQWVYLKFLDEHLINTAVFISQILNYIKFFFTGWEWNMLIIFVNVYLFSYPSCSKILCSMIYLQYLKFKGTMTPKSCVP